MFAGRLMVILSLTFSVISGICFMGLATSGSDPSVITMLVTVGSSLLAALPLFVGGMLVLAYSERSGGLWLTGMQCVVLLVLFLAAHDSQGPAGLLPVAGLSLALSPILPFNYIALGDCSTSRSETEDYSDFWHHLH